MQLAEELWSHNYREAEPLSFRIRSQAQGLRGWARHALRKARHELACCRLVHEIPSHISPLTLYAVLLVLIVASYGAVVYGSSVAWQRKYRVLSGHGSM